MNIGRLRHRVTFEELTTELDSDGQADESWTMVFGRPLSAEITPLAGRELIAAQAVQSEVSTRITIRYRTGLKAAMRAVHRDTVYNILAVIPDVNSGVRSMTLLCASGVNEG